MARMAEFTLRRSTHVDADPATVRALVDDLHRWVEWSPWEGLDPDLTRTYTGPERGVGSSYAWKGNRRAGEGTMTITGSTAEQVDLDLSFVKPFKATNQVTFDLVTAGGGTDVTWTMRGTRGRVGELFTKVFRMDERIGADLDKGLAELKDAAERA